MTRLLALTLFLGMAQIGVADDFDSTANTLLRHCKIAANYLDNKSMGDSNKNWLSFGYCMGYVIGTRDALFLEAEVAKESPGTKINFCLPDKVSNGQLVRIVNKYLEGHPESLHELAQMQVQLAYIEAFPCGARAEEK